MIVRWDIDNFKKRLFQEQLKYIEDLYENSKMLYDGDITFLPIVMENRKKALFKFKGGIFNWIRTQQLVEPWIVSYNVSIMPAYGNDFVPNILKDFTYHSSIDINIEKMDDTSCRIMHAIHMENYNFVYKRKPSTFNI